MIKEQDLLEAIAECQGERYPDARTCIKLASYYTILNNIREESRVEASEQVRYGSGSAFGSAIADKNLSEVLAVIDELMDTIQVLMPKLYDATLERLIKL